MTGEKLYNLWFDNLMTFKPFYGGSLNWLKMRTWWNLSQAERHSWDELSKQLQER